MLRRPMNGAPFTPAEIEAAIKVLEAIAGDRGALAHVEPRDVRLRLLEAAGRVSLPNRAEQRKLAKAFRRKQAGEVRAADEALLDATGIRALRRAPVFVTPEPQALVEGAPRAALPSHLARRSDVEGGPEVQEPRKCYVCKASFTRLHFFYDQLVPFMRGL